MTSSWNDALLASNFVFPVAVLARLSVALTKFPDFLRHDQQLSSPLTSYSHLQEGIYLFQHGIDPYSGGVFRHSPLYLSVFTTVLPNSRTSAAVLWTLFDALGAWSLVQIWRARQRAPKTRRDGLIALTYLLNPYLCLPSLALSTSTLENTLGLLAIMFTSQSKASPALLTLSILLHLTPNAIILVAPLLLLLVSSPISQLASPRPFSGKLSAIPALLAEFAGYTALLTLVSTVVAGGWGWVGQTWLASLTLPDLTPNPGLWWYFFTEMFDYFRPFFLMVFSVHVLIYVAPICIKFQYDPLFATFLLLGILGTFKSYPTLSDPGLFLSMTSIFPEIYPHLRHPIVTSLLHLHASLLLPIFHHLWLSTGTGNANFFYASTLVLACANGAAVVDCIWAGLRVAIGKEMPADEWVVVQE